MNFDLIVSIVIYNPALPLLQQTLDSLSNSKLKIQVALFDNSKNPLNPVELRCQQPLDYVFNNKNIGYGSGHNQNMRKWAQQAPYFLILNPDVFFETSLLDTLHQRMEQDQNIGVCVPKICHPTGDIQLIHRRLPRPQDYLMSFLNNKFKTELFKTPGYQKYLLEDFNTSQSFVCPIISGCFMFFRQQALLSVGGFDERFFLYLEDTDLSRRVSEQFQAVVFSDLTAYHYWSRGAYKSLKLFTMFVRNLIRYFNKWGWIFDSKRDQLNSLVRPYSLQANTTDSKESSVLNPVPVFDTVK